MADHPNHSKETRVKHLQKKAKEASRARKPIRQATASQVEPVPIRQESDTHSRASNPARALKNGRWMLWIGYGALGLGGGVLLPSFRHSGWTGFVLAGVLLALGWVLQWAGRRTILEALDIISRTQDTQTIGHVINFLMGNSGDWQTSKRAQNTLVSLLHRLTEEEASHLSALQRLFLYQRIKHGDPNRDRDLLIAILAAFERGEDCKAIPAVQMLLQREMKGSKARRVQEKAQQCLTLLIERSEQIQADTTLLRAADNLQPSGEALLRPVMSTQEDAPEELLRAYEEETE